MRATSGPSESTPPRLPRVKPVSFLCERTQEEYANRATYFKAGGKLGVRVLKDPDGREWASFCVICTSFSTGCGMRLVTQTFERPIPNATLPRVR